jgi:hypothetical protein
MSSRDWPRQRSASPSISGRTIVPTNLAALYEDPGRIDPWTAPYVLSAIVILVVTAAVIALRSRWPAGAASWVYYVLLLAPVLGFAQSGPQLVADRYSYLSCLPWAVLVGAGLFGSGGAPCSRVPPFRAGVSRRRAQPSCSPSAF